MPLTGALSVFCCREMESNKETAAEPKANFVSITGHIRGNIDLLVVGRKQVFESEKKKNSRHKSATT